MTEIDDDEKHEEDEDDGPYIQCTPALKPTLNFSNIPVPASVLMAHVMASLQRPEEWRSDVVGWRQVG